MKRWQLATLVVVVVLLGVLFFVSSGTTQAVDNPAMYYFVNCSGSLNVRSEPKVANENTIGKLYYADQVTVYSTSDEWATIDYNGSLAYVMTKFLSLEKPLYLEATSELSSNNIANLRVQAVGYLKGKTNYYSLSGKKMSGTIPEGLISTFAITNGYAYVAKDRILYKIKVDAFEFLNVVDPNGDICYEPIITAYTTFFSNSQSNRVNNINLGAIAMEKILHPGEIYSFNETVGERTFEKGYLLANAYAYGQIVEACGGGVCQLSSTLYAAIRQDQNFSIISRSPHNPEVTYLPWDMDATVNWKNVDFKFQNNYPFAVKVESHVHKGMMTILMRRIIEY